MKKNGEEEDKGSKKNRVWRKKRRSERGEERTGEEGEES